MIKIDINDKNVKIYGDIIGVEDFEMIKNEMEEKLNAENIITLEIIDSSFITSSLIGYFYKLLEKDGIHLKIKVGKKELMEVFEDLNLVEKFEVSLL
jgi:positive regulator of sigma E activity